MYRRVRVSIRDGGLRVLIISREKRGWSGFDWGKGRWLTRVGVRREVRTSMRVGVMVGWGGG